MPETLSTTKPPPGTFLCSPQKKTIVSAVMSASEQATTRPRGCQRIHARTPTCTRELQRRILAPTLLAWTLSACGQPPAPPSPCPETLQPGSPLGVRCAQLVDAQGRVIFLRGINARIEGLFDVTFDDGRTALQDIPTFNSSDAESMQTLGFDSIRIPINWSGVEPSESGGFNEAYLLALDQAVEDAASAGLKVLIDFHQDAYSKEIGEDGAPLWAIQPPPTELLEGPLDNLEERRLSAQVIAAFETFFGAENSGAALRQRFVQMAVHVAKRYAEHPAVFGFEIFNEPVTDDAGIERLNRDAYAAIRAAAPQKLYIFEPPAVRNFTDQAKVPAAPLGQATGYAPHVYTFSFTATDEQRLAMTKELLRRSNANARSEADAWQAPLVITEWGIDPRGPLALDYLRWQSELQDEYNASSFFWLWKEQSQDRWGLHDYDPDSNSFSLRPDLVRLFARPRLAALAGWPHASGSHYDADSGQFSVDFSSDPEVLAPHLLAVPPAAGAIASASCNGQPIEPERLDRVLVALRCGQGQGGQHQLRLQLSSPPSP